MPKWAATAAIALVLGIVFSMALGAGLALLFWSNRKGYDR